MVATRDKVHEFVELLDECAHHYAEIWDTFAHDGQKEAQVLRGIVELAFSLSEEQVRQMEQGDLGGLAASALTAAQKTLLARIEPIMHELRFLEDEPGLGLAQSRLRFLANGQMGFVWAELPGAPALCLRWLPHSVNHPERRGGFGQTQRGWRIHRSCLMQQHSMECRRAAECSRRVFELAVSLSPEQFAWMVQEDTLPVTALSGEQRALVEAAVAQHPKHPPHALHECLVRFDREGQFTLIHRGRNRVSHYSACWLPASWNMRGTLAPGEQPCHDLELARLMPGRLSDALIEGDLATGAADPPSRSSDQRVSVGVRRAPGEFERCETFFLRAASSGCES
jgi:hypothetical protein